MKRVFPAYLFFLPIAFFIILINAGCANIIPPTGGARDTIPPILIAESPMDSAKNVTTKRFTFVFNEFVELQEVRENVLLSPTPVNDPNVVSKLRTVTVTLRDSLEPNTTYSINFGNAIRDINEGNILKDFSYVFSTGDKIDFFTLSGKVTLAETGKADSNLIVLLHKNVYDSAVAKERPRYIARVDAQGNYTFKNLPPGSFALYAVPNTNYNQKFDESTLFAFADKPVSISATTAPVNLFAYIEKPKVNPANTGGAARGARDQNKVLRFATNVEGTTHDLLESLQLIFDKKIKAFDTSKIILTNKDFIRQRNYYITPDSSATRFSLTYNWNANTAYKVIIAKDAFRDSAGATLAKADTIEFTTKKVEEYGTLKIRFNNFDAAKNPVLLIVQNDIVIKSVRLTQRDYIQKLFKPGEYGLRLLYDTNQNGRWDAGEFFGKRRQPEIVRHLNDIISVRADWDNEKEVNLAP